MASKSEKKTKYTYKGNNQKADNKYANIFQDLSKKEEIYKSNVISKIHKNDDKEDEGVESVELLVREVPAKEAKLNAKKRRQAAKNAKTLAIRKSSPIIGSSKDEEFNKQESLEILKKQKLDAKNRVLDNLNQEGEEADKNSLDLEKTVSIDALDREVENSEYIDEDEFIRQKARQRAKMDKSQVEIYKEYSDFDRVTPKKENNKEDKKLDFEKKEIKKNISRDPEAYSDTRKIPVENNIENYVEDKTSIYEIEKAEERAKAREKEIEEILKLKDSTLGETRKNSARNRKERKNKKTPEERANRNIQFKKVIFVFFLIALLVVASSAALSRFKNSKSKPNKNNVSVTVPKKESEKESEKEKKQEADKESLAQKKSKLEAIRSKLNDQESKRLDYIIENIESYPEEMINQLASNHELVDFVYSYKDRDKYNEKPIRQGISSSYNVDGEVPLFLQWDRRWAYRPYGNSIIGLSGCGPTSLAMVIKHFDKNADVNPYNIAKTSQEKGYVSKENSTSWKLFETGLRKYGLESRDIVPVEAKMKRALDDGQILIVSVKPGVFTRIGHIIVIKGYDKNGDFLINDPNSITNTKKAWTFDELKNQIRKIWAIYPIGSLNKGEEAGNNTSSQNTDKPRNEKNDSTGDSQDPSIIQDID